VGKCSVFKQLLGRDWKGPCQIVPSCYCDLPVWAWYTYYEELTRHLLEEKTSWVESSPTEVFDIDPATQRVSLFSSTSLELFPMISCTDQWSSSFCSCAYDQWTLGFFFFLRLTIPRLDLCLTVVLNYSTIQVRCCAVFIDYLDNTQYLLMPQYVTTVCMIFIFIQHLLS
jgi:hypothetical protein